MSLAYRVDVGSTISWTGDSDLVQSIDLSLHKEHKAISTLNVRVVDLASAGKRWPIYNSIPDPAFSNIPVKLSISDPNLGPSSIKLVFDGKLASLQAGYPASEHTSIVAHDHSLTARSAARYKTYKGLHSVDIVKRIAKDYGFDVDTSSLIGVILTQQAINIGMSTVDTGMFSDWQHLSRALAGDGLELYLKGKKIFLRQLATAVYPVSFTPDDGRIITLEVVTNHVSGPGAGGQSKTPLPGGNSGSVNSAQGSVALEAVKEGSVGSTHRTPPQGAKQGTTGAHTESLGSLSGPSKQQRRRKDEATLVLRLSPDIGMQHVIPLKGWGQKIDGNWFIQSINHSIAGGAGTTTLHLTNEPSKGSLTQSSKTPLPGGTA